MQSNGGENFRVPSRRRQNLTEIQYFVRKDIVDSARSQNLLQYLSVTQRIVVERLYSEEEPLSPAELAREFNVSKQAVNSAEKVGLENISLMLEKGKDALKKGRPSKVEEEFGEELENTVRNLYQIQRLFMYQIADVLNVSLPTVRRMVKRYNIQRPRIENNRLVPQSIEAVEKSIFELGLNKRELNALARSGIFKIDDLFGMSEKELSSLRGIGKKSLQNIQEKIEQYREKAAENK